MKNKNQKNIDKKFQKLNNFFIYITLIIYLIVTLYILFHHEPWRDEAQSWLLARDLKVFGLYKQMMYEGHPFLWHLILMPFAKLNFPYITLNIISFIIMFITAFLILKKAPFNKLVKIIIIFSLPFIYTYSVISRSYCLIPLALILLAINYSKRHEKPITYILNILLLAQTHVIMYALVGILLILFYYEEFTNKRSKSKEEKQRIYISLIIIVIGLLFTLIPIFISTKISIITEWYTPSQNNLNTLTYITYQILGVNNQLVTYIIGVIFLLFLLFELKYYKKEFLIFIVSIGFQFFIYDNLFSISEQRIQSIIFIFIFIMWIQKKYNNIDKKIEKTIAVILLLFLILNSYNGFKSVVISDLKTPFSTSKELGEYINKNIPNNSTFIIDNMPKASAVVPYVAKENNFYGMDIKDYFTYVTWNYEEKLEGKNDFKAAMETVSKAKDTNVYFICYDYCQAQLHDLLLNKTVTLMHKNYTTRADTYELYKVNIELKN